jgi:putative tricarboxylic transport membrane protein
VVEDEARAAIIGADEKIKDKVDLKTMGVVLGLMVAYALLFEPLGYAITTFLVFTSGCWFLDRKHMVRDTIIAVIASFGLYFIFTLLLRVNIPAGLLKILGL